MSTFQSRWSEIVNFPHRYKLLTIIICSVLGSSYLGTLIPHAIADLSKTYGDTTLFYGAMKHLLIIFSLVYLVRIFYEIGVSYFVCGLTTNARAICYERWILDYDTLRAGETTDQKFTQGEVIARLMSDTDALRELVSSGAVDVLIDVFFILSCLISFIAINSTTGWALVSAEVLASILLLWGSKYMRTIYLSVRAARADISKVLSNLIGGVTQTFYLKHGEYASKKGHHVFEDFLKKQLHANIWDASYYSVAESLYPLFLLLVALVVPYSQITEAAIIFAIVDLIQRSIKPIKDVTGKVASIQRAISGIQRIQEFLQKLAAGESSPSEKIHVESNLISMTIDISHFSYGNTRDLETPFALTDINFSAKRGELVGIVGTSGCGKSTLLNILSGNIIPSDFSIRLDHADDEKPGFYKGLTTDEIAWYREQVSIVSQDSHVFSEDIAFNISLGQSGSKNIEEFWQQACMEIPYLERWGVKLHDKVHPETLSLGQRQLLSGLRSCYLRKPIVLFDEISSALDSELEEALRTLVLLIQRNSLTIIVAHRVETLFDANLLLLMKDGRVICSGKHSSLLDSSSEYREFLGELSGNQSCASVSTTLE